MTTAAQPGPVAVSPFPSVIAAVDGSTESVEAARQGARIAPGVPVTLVYVLDTPAAFSRVRDFPAWAHTARRAATELLHDARHHLESLGPPGRIDTAIEEGELLDGLRYITQSRPDALLTLGPYQEQRSGSRPIPAADGGGRPDWVIEAVACSVLLAKPGTDAGRFPASVVVGVDGSAPSMHAYEVAAAIASRTATALTVVTALGGKGPDLQALREADPHIPVDRIEAGHPVAALTAGTGKDDLIVVGNRGLHGLRSLGSVSARLANRSPAPVLVVRHHSVADQDHRRSPGSTGPGVSTRS